MIRAYVDANILITAFRGNDAGTDAAIRVLGEPGRQFVSSPFLRLETLRKPLFYDRSDVSDNRDQCGFPLYGSRA